jgi:ubiquitin-protein ligase|tara:strand:+ start:8014 stop:8469 length:456 start_codon:yes stop_codon:yes gene_type:complete
MKGALCMKRFKRDLEKESIEYFLNDDSYAKFQYNKYNIEMSITEAYPFHPPIVIINNKKISYSPYGIPDRIYSIFLSHFKWCPCCRSITCFNNWAPSFSVIDIVKEYIKFINSMKSYYKMHILTTENIDLNLPYEIIKEILSYVIEPWKPE